LLNKSNAEEEVFMKQLAFFMIGTLILFSSYAAAAPAQLSGSPEQQIQQLNSQIQNQLKQLQEQQQQQLSTLNTQLQSQMKQIQSQLQNQIQTLNQQTQEQVKQLQSSLQEQIKQLQQAAAQPKGN
jgi:DNA anti-recombination protein RmuC